MNLTNMLFQNKSIVKNFKLYKSKPKQAIIIKKCLHSMCSMVLPHECSEMYLSWFSTNTGLFRNHATASAGDFSCCFFSAGHRCPLEITDVPHCLRFPYRPPLEMTLRLAMVQDSWILTNNRLIISTFKNQDKSSPKEGNVSPSC